MELESDLFSNEAGPMPARACSASSFMRSPTALSDLTGSHGQSPGTKSHASMSRTVSPSFAAGRTCVAPNISDRLMCFSGPGRRSQIAACFGGLDPASAKHGALKDCQACALHVPHDPWPVARACFEDGEVIDFLERRRMIALGTFIVKMQLEAQRSGAVQRPPSSKRAEVDKKRSDRGRGSTCSRRAQADHTGCWAQSH